MIHKQDFYDLQDKDLCEVREFDGVGAEKFAYPYVFANNPIEKMSNGRCWVELLQCAEHGANSAIHTP